MALPGPLGAAPPHGPAYVVVLLLHVAAAVVGFGTVVASGVQAARLGSVPDGAVPSGSLLRWYAPGANWAGRVIYLVPVLGLALVGQSQGAFHLGDGWILGGLGLWAVAAIVAEAVLWPAERRIRGRLAGTFEVAAPVAGGPAVKVTDPGALAAGSAAARPLARRASVAAWLITATFVAATVLMVAQP